MKIFFCIIFLSTLLIYGCDKMEEKNETSQIPPMNMNRPDQTQTEPGSEKKSGDMMAVTLQNLAEDAEVQFQKNQSQDDKKVLVEAHLNAGNYLMFEADLPAKQKYRPALKHFRRVLELDPGNPVAAANKKQIEDIYESMGMPIPQ